jgi:hypothetical protein
MNKPPAVVSKKDATPLRIHARDASPHMAEVREALFRRDILYLAKERDYLKARIDGLEARIDGLDQVIRDREADILSLRAALDREGAQLRHEKGVSAAIYASRSWRIGAPIRALSTALRHVLGSRPQRLPDLLPLPAAAPQALLPAPPPQEASTPSPAIAGSRGRILIAAHFLPLFDLHSGGLRLKTIIDLMGSAGWSLVFASSHSVEHQPGPLSTPDGRQRYENVLRQAGVSEFLHGMDEITTFLRTSGRDLDWAFLSFPEVASALIPLIRIHSRTARILFDMVDFHALRLSREAALQGNAALQREAERQEAIEVACAEAADLTVAVSTDEKAALLELVPHAAVEVLPNIFNIPPEPPAGVEGRKGLLFVGGFWHRPNGDAVCWFVDRILPRILSEAPETVLTIVGSNISEEVRALGERPGVEARGFVEDLVPLFRASRAFVAPLRYGAGMKGKVGQSMAHGLPVVATTVGAEGMGLRPGEHILVADREEEFAAEVLRLLRDDALWARLSEQGLQQIEATLSAPVVSRQLEALLGG